MQLVKFEAYRDLIKLLQLGVAEEAGILLAEDENLDARAAAKSNAAAQAALTGGQASGPKAIATPAGACMSPRLLAEHSFCQEVLFCTYCSVPAKGMRLAWRTRLLWIGNACIHQTA